MSLLEEGNNKHFRKLVVRWTPELARDVFKMSGISDMKEIIVNRLKEELDKDFYNDIQKHIRGEEMEVKTIDLDKDLKLRKEINDFFNTTTDEHLREMSNAINNEKNIYGDWVVYPMENLRRIEEIEKVKEIEQASWDNIKLRIQDLRAIDKTEDEILKEIHWYAFSTGYKFGKEYEGQE